MGLIKRADIEDYTRNAYVMDLEDLEKRGRAMIDSAIAEAKSILEMANAKRRQLLASAEKDGYKKGHHDGYEQGYIDGVVNGVEDARKDRIEVLNQLTDLWNTQLDAFESQRDSMIERSRTQIVELGAMIAQRVTRRVIELDPNVVLAQLEAVLSSVTESSRLVIAVHPEDIAITQSELGAMVERFSSCEHAQLVTDPTLARGSCVARSSSGGVVDASINTQLDRIIEAILPTGGQMKEIGRLGGQDNQVLDDIAESAVETDEDEQSQGDAA